MTAQALPGVDSRPLVDELGAELGRWLSEKLGPERQVFLTTWTFAPTPWAKVPGLQYVNKARGALSTRLDSIDASAFITTERGALEGRLHLHSLSDSAAQLDHAERWWKNRYGFVKRSSPCEARIGAAMYVAKYVTKSTGALVAPMFSAVGPRFPVMNASR